MPLDPQLRALFERAEQVPPPSEAGVIVARAGFEAFAATWPREPVGTVEELAVAGADGLLRGRLYHPAPPSHGDQTTGLVVFFHGGGWVLGSIDTHDAMCRSLCRRSGVPVLSVGYRLAPEHPFPAGVDDAIAAVTWVHANHTRLGTNGPLAVAGDSAGATLSAVTCLAARAAGGPPIAFQLLLYPATDLRMMSPSYDECGAGYLLTRAEVAWYLHQYGLPDVTDWRVSPLLAADVSGLPPAHIVTAEYDPLRDEAEEYGARLATAGVDVTVRRYPGMVHGFAALPDIDVAAAALADAAAAVQAALGRQPSHVL